MKTEHPSLIDLIKIAGPKLFSEIFGIDLKQSENFFNYLNKKESK